MKTKYRNTTQIVKLRNPHGEGEWKGAFSDKWLTEHKSQLWLYLSEGKTVLD